MSSVLFLDVGWTLEFEYGSEVVTESDRERTLQMIWRELDALQGVEIAAPPVAPGKLGPLTDALVASIAGGAAGSLVTALVQYVQGRVVRSVKVTTRPGSEEIVLDSDTIKEAKKIAEKLRLDD